MQKTIILYLAFISSIFSAHTQEIAPPEYIKTIQFKGNSEFSGTPIIQLGTPLLITFDDINGDEADYYYKIRHCNFDWTPSILNKNEYLDGFDDIRINDYENSFNTLQTYSHYFLRIPNEDTKALKVSGNYIIEIYNEDEELVFSRKLIVYENTSTVKVYTKRSRDLDFINTKQSVQFEITPHNPPLRNPKKTVKTLVIQNNDIKNSISNLTPQFTIGNSLIYKYDQEASFWGSNEFLFFDNKEVRTSTVNIQKSDLEDIYHNYLYNDRVRAAKNYTRNPDINGGFVIRNLRANNHDIEADYVWMHFTLECYEPIGDGNIHIYGSFNNFKIDNSTLMKYDKNTGMYHNTSLFKQGFYNYKYILVLPDNTIDYGFISGNFDETENEYTVIAYYRAPGARYDRAIGKGTGNSSTITN
ncbi:DUF5103 domain-containing protein [Aquimarina sp. TRL1]|uniref:type IX secretion system plug protein n=1 Tax=Aquimarina sp. (strain TRL1) TaxID=2736252 RepID=UPI00158E2A9E|nr:DUF5103 domain-containing protein [Aquimarina sp. TRL1]QKX05544.1 DUF5103 domain-containing protein [Aquimarina sp. TRL1]